MNVAPQVIDLLVHGAAQVATPQGSTPRGGADLGRISIVHEGAVAIHDGRVLAVGPARELEASFAPARRLDAHGGTVVPGFVDAHTHPIFAGTREDEFELRAAGKTYVEISLAGGGIVSTMRGVRGASQEQLVAQLLGRMDRFLALGTTTVEAKTGYGLELETELRCLRVLDTANRMHPIELVSTFLGAHDFPPEYRDDRAGYVDHVCDEMLPRVAESGLAEYADIFTEAHVFDLDQSRRIMNRARELGFGLRLHVDQLTPLGGAQLAAELRAASADHLECVTRAGIEALAAAAVQPVLCPVVPLFLRDDHEAPARAMIDAGLAPAIATDFNPGSCYLQSMAEVCSWSALRYGMSAAECLTASTLNAACSLGRGADRGTLEPGKRADLLVLDVPNLKYLCYELGRSPVAAVVVGGELAYERGDYPSPRLGRGVES
ncbi:imidazolonepropionase [Engelhardtia mirabilis]|uniref:Imidazolonepropionase n=1 Tax=Engelhardtia mirabilis TaxID=2528011 RepID=A0A518BNG2_9BACT|nr:Imidazolonepropionase [Planctomycetes bacterium Pla133]QDV02822.1 Imidazolonepropionase [Planctomycetes bacterium Pla86]